MRDSNPRPFRYERNALPTELSTRFKLYFLTHIVPNLIPNNEENYRNSYIQKHVDSLFGYEGYRRDVFHNFIGTLFRLIVEDSDEAVIYNWVPI